MDEGTEPGDEPALQPVGTVPRSWLASFETSDEAKRVAALEADRDLLYLLMWSGYSGDDYEMFAERLARYGVSVITAWCLSGSIFSKCAAKGWTIENQVPISRDDAQELAYETVAVALHKFRETVLIPRVWDPKRGASIKTFFIGQCLLRFLNEYRRWWRSERRSVAVWADPAVAAGVQSRDGLPGDELEEYERYSELLARLGDDAETHELALYKSEGFSDEEIAELCGLSVPSVKSRFYRMRRKVHKGA